jgi:hypothetical protein
MKRQHRKIQERLYESVVGRLSAQEQQEIEEHCRECAECRADLEALDSVVRAVGPPAVDPSEQRDALYWAGFADRVEARIGQAKEPRTPFWKPWLEELEALLTRSWKPVGAAAGVLALAVVFFLLSGRESTAPPTPPAEGPSVATAVPDSTRERFAHYLRKSGTLLVGLTNRKIDDDHVDLSAERELSRELVHESRELQKISMDPQADRLVGDMERILIEIASRNPITDREHFDLIRSGINQENLLFKVRMTESMYQAKAVSYERIR